MKRGVLFLLLGTIVFVGASYQNVAAERYTGGSYIIDAAVGNSFGGASSSTSYELVGSGGESIIGQGSGGSYRLGSGYVAQLENSMELSVQPNGLAMYYPLDETSGTAVYDSGAGAHLATTVADPTWTTGQVGGAVSLNGSSQYITAADVDIPTNITLEAWVYPTSTQTSTILSKHSGTDNQGRLALASGVPSFIITTGATERTATAGSALPNNTWSHVVGVYDGSNVTLYVDGNEADTVAATGAITTNNYLWTIGRDANASSNYFAGRIDEVKVLTRALSADEIEAEYDAGAAGDTAGLSFAGGITPGVSQTSNFDAIVATDAFGYVLAVNQNQDLTKGGDTISAMSGTVASPSAWSEGTTTGLGFTLYGTNATGLDAKWNSGANYAGFPGTATTIYTREGQPQGTKDVLNMRLRLDVASSQPSGLYTNVITTTGTLTP